MIKNNVYVHGNNISQKLKGKFKYNEANSVEYLKEISERYEQWKKANVTLVGPLSLVDEGSDNSIIKKRVTLLNEYKDFLDQQKYAEHFDSRSNLHSSVLEEFMYYLFKDIVAEINPDALIGKSHSFKDIFFRSSSYKNMVKQPCAIIEKKDHDFSIGISVTANLKCNGSAIDESHIWDIPAVAIECKTYLDKTMLQDVSTAAEEIKLKNPNAMYIVVAEWLKLTENINLKKYKIDQIYVLRKQKNTDREYRYQDTYVKNPLYDDVFFHLFTTVREFLTADWETGIKYGLENGYLL